MVALFKYHGLMGSQYSVRAGNVDTLKYQIFFRDGLKMLLEQGTTSKKKSIREQFDYPMRVYIAQCDGTLTLDMIKDFKFTTDLGGFECLEYAESPEEKDHLCETVLQLSEKKRTLFPFIEAEIQKLINYIKESKKAETQDIIDGINSIHHVL